jgi:hypothetical protein
MTTYRPLSDCVGVLETVRIEYHWARSAEGEKVFTHTEVKPMRCLVWAPNEVRDRPAEQRRVLALSIANAEAA